MKQFYATACAALALLALPVLAPARADDAAAPDSMREAAAPYETLRLAAGLARWGREHRDPWALAQAARIRLSAGVQEVERMREGSAAADRLLDGDSLATAWLAEAEALGGADPRLSALIEDIRTTAYKGRIGGPRVSFSSLPAGQTHRYGEPFDSGFPAVVYVEGDGDTDLALTVRGPDGATACTDRAPGDMKLCAWRPAKSGRYEVEVSNRGKVDNRYAFSTN
jgi:hypothetical protein